jgi:hypothetical protein
MTSRSDLPNSDRADFASDQWSWLDYYTQPPSDWDGVGGEGNGSIDFNDRNDGADSRRDPVALRSRTRTGVGLGAIGGTVQSE